MSQMIEMNLRPDERTCRQFGWIALGVELLKFPIGAMSVFLAEQFEPETFKIALEFSPTGILVALRLKGETAEEMIRQLVLGQEAVVRTARAAFPVADKANDEPTADLLTQRMQIHEKNAWMLRSLLDE